METNYCNNKCCKYLLEPYISEFIRKISDKKIRRRKAGGFIYDRFKNKLLLVQSRGQLWGLPKGSFNETEIATECAMREIKEETGIDVNIERNMKCFCLNVCAYYYYLEMNETNISIQKSDNPEENDANGIGWFNLDCLKEMCISGKLRINKHTQLAIKNFLF